MEDFYYRGDTFIFSFSLKNSNKEDINWETDDILKFGAKESINTDEYVLYKKIVILKETAEIQFQFPPEETRNLNKKRYIIELELTRGDYVETVYQGPITVKGDVVRNGQNDSST